jgi:hypothetical protein
MALSLNSHKRDQAAIGQSDATHRGESPRSDALAKRTRSSASVRRAAPSGIWATWLPVSIRAAMGV